jgi:small subunit ribosomal protein S3
MTVGQKTHPYGFRLGFNKPWSSRWFAKGPDYARLIHEDLRMKKAIKDKAYLETIAKRDVYVDIREVDKPELNALLIGESIAVQLEKRIAYRRAMRKAVEFALKMGAKGIKVMCAGRLGGVEIARSEWYLKGQLPLQTLRADIDYAFTEAFTTYGQIGIKVWVYRADVEKPKFTSQMAEVEEI